MTSLVIGGLRLDVDAVVFDKDGTLLDLHAAWAGRAAWWCNQLARLAGEPALATDLARSIDLDLDPPRVHSGGLLAAGTIDQTVRALNDALGRLDVPLSGSTVRRVLAEGQGEVRPLGDVVGTFHRLKGAGLAIGVLTSDDHRPAVADLAALGVLELVDRVCAADDVTHPKPDPEGFISLSAAFGLAPSRCVMVGDSPGDIEAGRRGGAAAVVLVTDSAGWEAARAPADAVISSIDQLQI